MKNYDVYKIENSGKATFLGVVEAANPIAATEKAKIELSIKNCTMQAFATGSPRAEMFAAGNK